MRNRILSSLCVVLFAGAAFAQGQMPDRVRAAPQQPRPPAPAGDDSSAASDDNAAAPAGGETEGAEVADQPAGTGKITPKSGGKDAAPGEVHTVVKGDTLWDLSQRFLGNPWYWPKVWSYNPEIANPHWIYPGNNVRFFPAGEEVPSRVEAGTGPEGVAPSEDVSEAESPLPPELQEGQLLVSGKIGYVAPTTVKTTRAGFVTPRELDESGHIDSSFAESVMLSFPDKIYIDFKKRGDVHVGDRYVIFHTETEIDHPVTGARFGFLTKILGTVKIVSVGDQLATGQIVDTWDAITRGDLVGPYGEKLNLSIAPKPNDRDLKAYVIGALNPDLTMMGEYTTIIVDKGSADGVQEGNTFTVVRQGNLGGNFRNPAIVQDTRLPLEDIGSCIAADVRERATMCILTKSIREIVWGDRLEMRAAHGGGAPVSQR